MVTNKAILGFLVVLIMVIGAVMIARRNPNFLARLRRTPPTPTSQQTVPTQMEQGVQTTQTPLPPSAIKACSDQLIASCSDTQTPVCGSERVVSSDGTELRRSLTYRNACAYCKLYGQSKVLDLGDAKYYPEGYTEGMCVSSATVNTK